MQNNGKDILIGTWAWGSGYNGSATKYIMEVTVMDKYVSLDKRSKKAQREYHAKQRRTWGELNPVTRSVPSGKTYNRKKEKQRTGKEFRNGFDAGFYIIPDRNHEGIENAQFNT